MRVRLSIASLTLIFGFAVVACRPPAEGANGARAQGNLVQVTWEIADEPRVGPTALVVRVMKDGAPVTGASVEVTGDMTHAGMVPVIANAPMTEPGMYVTQDFAFDMAGDWVLTAEIHLEDGLTVTNSTETTVARP